MADGTDGTTGIDQLVERERKLAEREEALARARAQLRAEREQLATDHAEVHRQLTETRTIRQEADRDWSRARRVAGRFVRYVEQRNKATQRQLEADRGRFITEITRWCKARTEFHTTAVSLRDQLHAAWQSVVSQHKRVTAEWSECQRHFAQQTMLLDSRTAELNQREKATAARLAKTEADTAGLLEEATALEHRVQNARHALMELERRRDHIRNELLRVELPADLAPIAEPDDLSKREQELAREKAAVAALRASLEREAADLNDHRRVVAEQLRQLADARVRWQLAERQTALEMEELARALRQKEQELDARDRRLIQADIRRREDAYELWQLRLRLQAWQSKITAFELQWHTEREQLEANLVTRVDALVRRESALGASFARWEAARTADHARLRAELERWSAERSRMIQLVTEAEQFRQDVLAELREYAARAIAAEQLVAETVQHAGQDRVSRRLAVLRKQWERVFDRKLQVVEAAYGKLIAERDVVANRYQALQARLTELMEREAAAADREASANRAVIAEMRQAFPVIERQDAAPLPPAELAELRAELERLAAAVIEMELPEPPETPQRKGNPESHPRVLPFGTNDQQAA